MTPGSKAKVTKRTFLHKGVFVFTGAVVEVLKIEEGKAMVLYSDREGHPHEIEFPLEELEPLEA